MYCYVALYDSKNYNSIMCVYSGECFYVFKMKLFSSAEVGPEVGVAP